MKTTLSRALAHVRKPNTPLVFGVLFGLIAICIGLTQIFAQASVIFTISPTSQTANANEQKSFAITLNTNGQQVDGGSVRITYDSAKVSLVGFSAASSPYLGISNQVSSAGTYSFDYQIYYDSQNGPSLGTLTLKANSLSTTQAAYLRFDASGTNAYLGFNPYSRTYYPSQYGQAALVVNAAPATPTPTPTPITTPTPTTTTTQSPTSTSPTTSTSAPSSSAPPTTSTPTQSNTNTSPVNTIAGPSATDTDTGTYSPDAGDTPVAKATHKSSFGAFIFIGFGVVLIASAAALFKNGKLGGSLLHRWGYAKKPLRHPAESEHVQNLEEENVVVHPEQSRPKTEPALGITAAQHEFPKIVTDHSNNPHKPEHKAPHPEGHKPPAPPERIPTAKPSLAAAETITHVKERTDSAHHKEVEVDFVHVKPQAQETVTSHADAKIHAAENAKTTPANDPARHESTPQESSKPKVAVGPNPLTHLAAATTKPLASAPQHEKTIEPPAHHNQVAPEAHKVPTPNAANIASSPAMPDWQTHLTQQTHKAASTDDPPDMFELAAEHPETFGSFQALEAEDPNGNTKGAEGK